MAKYYLLWKYYEKSAQLFAAARVLSRFADAPSSAISLPLRMEYLSRALVCIKATEKSSVMNPIQRQFLCHTEKKIYFAKIQFEILKVVSRLKIR